MGMKTTVVRPADPELRDAVRVACGFGVFTVLLHVALTLWVKHVGYGYFRDEFYYLICGRHLAWGYVDHGPMVALQARVAETLFGKSLVGLRMLSAIGGGVRVAMTGLIAWALGGRRAAQVLAMLGVLTAACYLGGDSYLSMNSWESTFWMGCLLAVMMVERGGGERWWLVFGASAGLGLLNKPDMAFFLLALLLGLLVTRQRRLLASWWMLAGVGLMLVIVAPYVCWQLQHGWPTWEFLRNGQLRHKVVILSPLAFIGAQVLTLLPLNALVWIPGLIWLLRRGRWRWLGAMYVVFLGVMMVEHAKDYYVVPVYPVLFAAGGLAWEGWKRGAKRVSDSRSMFGFPVLESVLVLGSAAVLPMSNPILKPEAWIAYANALNLKNASKTETSDSGPLPQFYADRFGWQEEVDQVERVVASLTPEERSKLLIVCDNYGEASALNFLGHGLPLAMSGQNNYWLWGEDGTGAIHKRGDVLITIENTTAAHLKHYYDDVQLVGEMGTTYSMPFEHKQIWLLKGAKQDFASVWPEHKNYI
jgi:hypothetical protein